MAGCIFGLQINDYDESNSRHKICSYDNICAMIGTSSLLADGMI